MNVLIMRHAEAQILASSDAQRALTDNGHQQACLAGQCINSLTLNFDQVWVSPYIRAQQTADGVVASLRGVEKKTLDFLVPEIFPSLVVDKLADSDFENLLIVSHQPLVSALVGLLEHADDRKGPPMSPASMVLLSTETVLAGCFQRQWLRHAPVFQAVR
jgi:phosphohistidine phosphatase